LGVLAGIGLACASGWNTFIPLLVLALADRIQDGDLLIRPYDLISSLGGILVLLLLVTVEVAVDKIPRLDLIHTIIGVALRPAAAAFCFMAITEADRSLHPVLAMLAGLVIGGAMHWWRAPNRVHVEQASNGLGVPLVSLVEDAMSAITAIAAVSFGPAGVAMALLGWYVLRWSYRWGSRFGVRRPTRA
jgi:hypothetical protein